MTSHSLARRASRLSLSLVAAAAAAGCANLQAINQQASANAAATSAAAPAGAASGATPGAAPGAASGTSAARPDPTAPKPFDEVIKGATRQAGYIPVWRKDEKVWFELSPEQFNQPILLSVNIAGSVGERGLYASQMGPNWLATFRKTGSTQVQLIALNTNYSADGAAMQATVAQAFSNSLLGSAAIASAPHKDSKAVLVDASFLLSRPAWVFDPRWSGPTACRWRWTRATPTSRRPVSALT